MNKEFRAYRGAKGIDFEDYLEYQIREKGLVTKTQRNEYLNSIDIDDESEKYCRELLKDYLDYCGKERIEPLNIEVLNLEDIGDVGFGFMLNPGDYESEEIDIPEFVSYTEDFLFRNSKVRRIRVTGGYTAFSNKAFSEAESVEEIVFEDGFKFIAPSLSFAGCRKLRKLRMPESVEVFGDKEWNMFDGGLGNFNGCDSLEEIDIRTYSMDYEFLNSLVTLKKVSVEILQHTPPTADIFANVEEE